MDNKKKLLLCGFLLLLLELSLIRFLPAQIACLGYYTNFILLASFFGIGAGMLIPTKYINLRWLFPWALLILVALCSKLNISISPSQDQELHFFVPASQFTFSETVIVPIVFIITSITFLFLSQYLGYLFNSLKPLEAYSWEILGSILGIVVFSIFSFLQTSPLVWFLTIAISYLILFKENSKTWSLSLLAFIILFFFLIPEIKNSYWSPYQKITTQPWINYNQPNQILGYHLFVNNIYHQTVVRDINLREWFYPIPYNIFNNANYKKALIIGAGTGNDVALALKNNVAEIDAVEIDPRILNLGKELNPNKSYQDPRVRAHISDARTFLQRTKKKYDLIIFALTDSLMLASKHGNIRLESYLFTLESFKSAKEHLTKDGLLVLYNNYRQKWLIDKLAIMLEKTFKRKPYVLTNERNSGILLSGGKLDYLKSEIPASSNTSYNPISATDDWPFLYLFKPGVPKFYFFMLAIITIFILITLSTITNKSIFKTIEPSYFFLGTAFLLLETKSIVSFSLFFGSTWFTNSLVFFAILVLIFLAIQLVRFLKINNITPWYIALVISLIIQYFIPMQFLLEYNHIIKYLIISIITFAPIFISNVIFSTVFKTSKVNSLNFASNILGAFLGGIIEYISLITGYKQLVLIILACYLIALFYLNKTYKNTDAIILSFKT